MGISILLISLVTVFEGPLWASLMIFFIALFLLVGCDPDVWDDSEWDE